MLLLTAPNEEKESSIIMLTEFMKFKASHNSSNQEFIYLNIGSLESGDTFVSKDD